RSWRDADAVALTAFGPDGGDLWTWTWPIAARTRAPMTTASTAAAPVRRDGEHVVLGGGDSVARISAAPGLLDVFACAGKRFALTNGPRLAWAHPSGPDTAIQWLPLEPATADGVHAVDADTPWSGRVGAARASIVEIELEKQGSRFGFDWFGLRLEISD